jgi:hypothetical protein
MSRNRRSGLLTIGALAGPLYIALGTGQILLRDGFDMRRHALSLLANGDWGWVQVANFILSGCLVALGAFGVRQALGGTRGGAWGPILLVGYAVGLIGAGIFRADPGLGFPPGVPAPASMTQAGLLHFVFGGIAFYSMIAASFVFARRFFAEGRRAWGIYSVTTGIGFFAAFSAIASGSQSPLVILTFYGAVAWLWIWHSLLMRKVAGIALG